MKRMGSSSQLPDFESPKKSSRREDDDPPNSYPSDPNAYTLHEPIGSTKFTKVYRATCKQRNINPSEVAIKIIDFKNPKNNNNPILNPPQPNILNPHIFLNVEETCFNQKQMVVMPLMSSGSLRSIVSSYFPEGMDAPYIATVLKEILTALSYLHGKGLVHRDIKASNIFVDLKDHGGSGSIKLADFTFSENYYCDLKDNLFPRSNTPYWLDLEMVEDFTAMSDIWLFGMTALELIRGKPPLFFENDQPFTMSDFTRMGSPLLISDYKKQRFTVSTQVFREMVRPCLAKDPKKRPTADELLKDPFFENCLSVYSLVKYINEKISLSNPFKEIVNEWDFNKHMLKFQARYKATTKSNLKKEIENICYVDDYKTSSTESGTEWLISNTNKMLAGLSLVKEGYLPPEMVGHVQPLEEQMRAIIHTNTTIGSPRVGPSSSKEGNISK